MTTKGPSETSNGLPDANDFDKQLACLIQRSLTHHPTTGRRWNVRARLCVLPVLLGRPGWVWCLWLGKWSAGPTSCGLLPVIIKAYMLYRQLCTPNEVIGSDGKSTGKIYEIETCEFTTGLDELTN